MQSKNIFFVSFKLINKNFFCIFWFLYSFTDVAKNNGTLVLFFIHNVFQKTTEIKTYFGIPLCVSLVCRKNRNN